MLEIRSESESSHRSAMLIYAILIDSESAPSRRYPPDDNDLQIGSANSVGNGEAWVFIAFAWNHRWKRWRVIAWYVDCFMEILLIARNETGMFCLPACFISVLIKTFRFDQWFSAKGHSRMLFPSTSIVEGSFVRLVSLALRVFAWDDRILLGAGGYVFSFE